MFVRDGGPLHKGLARAVTCMVCTALVALWSMDALARACAERTFEGSRFIVCTFDSARDELHLAVKGADGTALRGFVRLAEELGPDAARVQFAMNAGMYGVDGFPIGLYIENGSTLRRLNRVQNARGNFYMQPNGVFSLDRDGTVHVETTDAFAARNASPQWATQSGPMLVTGGRLNPNISDDGPSRNVRNGVGATGAHTAAFVISNDPVSFGRFARFFRDVLHCKDALYFDGAISSVWVPSLNRRDTPHTLGPMVVVLGR